MTDRLTDAELKSLAKSKQGRFRALAEECLEARALLSVPRCAHHAAAAAGRKDGEERPQDDEVRCLTGAQPGDHIPLGTIRALAREVLDARERGITGTVDKLSTSRVPTNMGDAIYVPSPKGEGGVTVASWTPEPDGKGRCTQVHLVFDLGHFHPGLNAVVRLKSGVGADRIIRSIYRHRCDVWPDYQGIRVKEASGP